MLHNFKKYTVRRVFLHFSTSISVHLYRFSHIYREYLLVSFLSDPRQAFSILNNSEEEWFRQVTTFIVLSSLSISNPFYLFDKEGIDTL